MEQDPDGKPLNSPGAKADAGKPLMSLVLKDFSLAITEVCKVGTYGAGKYSPSGWLRVKNGYSRYSDAMLRHYFVEQELDESGMLHDAQVAWNALARLELKLRKLRRKGKV